MSEGFTNDELWDWGEEKKPTQVPQPVYKAGRSIHWRQPAAGCKAFRNDQVIEDAKPYGDTIVIYYYMAANPSSKFEFRVPKDNLPFIKDAVEQGFIEIGKAVWVTIESDKNKRNRWIKIEEK